MAAAAGPGARRTDRRVVRASRPTRTCVSTPTTTRWTPAGRPPRRGARQRREIIAVALDTGEIAAATSGASPSTARSPPWSTRGRCGPSAAAPRARTRGARSAAVGLRRADRMSRSSELAHLFRALKAPAAARALPKLAERAREEQWSYERFAEALLSTEILAAKLRRASPDPPRGSPPAKRSRSSTSPSSAASRRR